MNLVSTSESDLIKDCIKGKAKAQKMLYDNFSRKMFGVCLRYAKNREEAEDFLQEGFMKVFSNIKQYTGLGSFEGWMRKIIVNTSLENIRKNKSMLFIGIDDGSIEDDSDYDFFEDSHNVQHLLKIIQSLSDGYRTIFNLYVVEGYSHKEISEKLGISEGTSKSQLSRARQLLKTKLLGTEIINTSSNVG